MRKRGESLLFISPFSLCERGDYGVSAFAWRSPLSSLRVIRAITRLNSKQCRCFEKRFPLSRFFCIYLKSFSLTRIIRECALASPLIYLLQTCRGRKQRGTRGRSRSPAPKEHCFLHLVTRGMPEGQEGFSRPHSYLTDVSTILAGIPNEKNIFNDRKGVT